MRGNGGGIDYSYLELLTFLYTYPYESKGVEWLAPKGNIEHFENALKNGNIRKGHEEDMKDLISLRKANQGYFIATEETKTNTVKYDSVFKYPQKIGLIVNDFFEDIGIRNAIVGYKTSDIHKILENVVYLHLRMAGYSVTVGQEGNKEIDFIAQKSGEKIYVQVAYMLTNEETINRKYGNLLEISDNFPKYVVTMDELNEISTYKRINRMHIKDFCLKMV